MRTESHCWLLANIRYRKRGEMSIGTMRLMVAFAKAGRPNRGGLRAELRRMCCLVRR